jgi:hypothetical protein
VSFVTLFAIAGLARLGFVRNCHITLIVLPYLAVTLRKVIRISYIDISCDFEFLNFLRILNRLEVDVFNRHYFFKTY